MDNQLLWNAYNEIKSVYDRERIMFYHFLKKFNDTKETLSEEEKQKLIKEIQERHAKKHEAFEAMEALEKILIKENQQCQSLNF